MANLKYSAAVNNAKMNAIESTVGTSAVLKIRTGAPPATVATADAGTVLATMTLPSDWMGASAAGIIAKLGTWSDTSADAAGTAGHFRLYASDGTTAHMQGDVTATGGGGDITLDNVVIAAAAVGHDQQLHGHIGESVMALPDYLKAELGTAIVWGHTGGSGVTKAMDVDALASAGAWMGASADLGATFDDEYVVEFRVETGTAPAAGVWAELYLAWSNDNSVWPGKVTGSNAAYPATIAANKLQLGPPRVGANRDR